MVPHVHGELCHFATHPGYGRFRQATVPRSWFKTWTWTVGKSIWLTLPDEEHLYAGIYPYKGNDVRILIASNVIDNAAKMVNKIKREWETNARLRAAFPELVPDFNKTRWSDHCAEVRRNKAFQEGTYTAVGVGGSVISQHFDHIIEDDLVYARKDDFSGEELMPSQEDIDNAVGWHKLSFSLLSDPNLGCVDNVGTRWAPRDLIDYIRNRESAYSCFEICSTIDGCWPVRDDNDCTWPERYGASALMHIREAQGSRIFETQYLNRPRAGADVNFNMSYLNNHQTLEEFPQDLGYITVVDLASWKDKRHICDNVILTGARDKSNHYWISRCDSGHYNPTQVIELIKAHQRQFKSTVYIEEVGYQESLRFFARKDMEYGEEQWYDIFPFKRENFAGAKETRIHGLEPVVSNGALHVLASMAVLKRQMEDYPYTTKIDILDVLGYLRKYARAKEGVKTVTKVNPYSLESIMAEIKQNKVVSGLPFDYQLSGGEI
jgi:hypothetical protein